MNNIIFASVISEIQQSPMFMTVKAVICDTPEANLNGARVTEKFVNEVVKNEKRYVGLPLYADVKALTGGKYDRLGHLYDVKTGEFHSTQIGSFYKFEKEEFDKGYHLIGYARIPKRNQKLSKAISELYDSKRLKFSFEVAVGEYDENEDGTITIDASEHNYLEGTAIVSYPACEDAVALQLVAQKTDVQEGGEQDMLKNLTAEQKPEEIAEETEKVEETKEVAEETTEETVEEIAEQVEEAVNDIVGDETAEVYVRETVTEKHETHAYDSETGKGIHQEIKVETTTEDVVDGTIVEAQDGPHIAEETKETVETDSDNSGVVAETNDNAEASTEIAEDTPTEDPTVDPAKDPADDPTDEPAEEPEEETPVTDAVESKKTAEQMIAELAEVIESLKNEIAELKEQRVVAETKVTAEVNPLMADINTQKKYGLLEKSSGGFESFSLLEKY